MSGTLAVLLALPFAAAAGIAAVGRRAPGRAAAAAAAACGALLALELSLLADARSGTAVRTALGWVPGVGLELAFRWDAPGGAVAVLVTLLAASVLWQRRAARARERGPAGVLAIAGAAIGTALADNTLLLVALLELTVVGEFLHRCRWGERAVRGLPLAVLVAQGGAAALLAGSLLVVDAADSARIEAVASAAGALKASSLHLTAGLLVGAGVASIVGAAAWQLWRSDRCRGDRRSVLAIALIAGGVLLRLGPLGGASAPGRAAIALLVVGLACLAGAAIGAVAGRPARVA